MEELKGFGLLALERRGMRERSVMVCKIVNGLARAGCENCFQNSEQSKLRNGKGGETEI